MNKNDKARAKQLAHEAALRVLPQSLSLSDIALLCWETDKINPAAMLKLLKGIALHNPSFTGPDGSKKHTRDGLLYLTPKKFELKSTGKVLDSSGEPLPPAFEARFLEDGKCSPEDVSPSTKLFVEVFQAAWQAAGKRPLSWFWVDFTLEEVKHESLTEKRLRVVEQVCRQMIHKGELLPKSTRWPRSAIYAESLEKAPTLFSGIQDDSASFKRVYNAVRKRLK